MNPSNAHGAYFIVPYCVDRLLKRAVLPTTVVTVSSNSWRNFSRFNLHLLECQGREKTQMKWADIGGLVCWREIPVDQKVATIEDAPARRGYWWHVPEDLIDFSDLGKLLSYSDSPIHFTDRWQHRSYRIIHQNGIMRE